MIQKMHSKMYSTLCVNPHYEAMTVKVDGMV